MSGTAVQSPRHRAALLVRVALMQAPGRADHPADTHVPTLNGEDAPWAQLTTPGCWILDWERWGPDPGRVRHASLYLHSLAAPAAAAAPCGGC